MQYEQSIHHTLELCAREVLLRNPTVVESFILKNRGWNFYDKEGKIINHNLPMFNLFHETFRHITKTYDIGNIYIKLELIRDISK